ncbi:hypothetical protein C8J48_0935 [Desmospora activa DSM 45169]|uniref:Uncharacterized protein n=1 Tax=Desmospora activa DSM 45169 TaxID=1121389 RepID=A0A2T4Z8Y5_9BACL|nr:hypothetical protein C8J48_0935 [Desmospora activa DSM 45169]
MEQIKLFSDHIFAPLEQNEMRRVFGPGPDGARCKTCQHLIKKVQGGAYLKCGLRLNTNGAETDHRAGWKACAKFEEADK